MLSLKNSCTHLNAVQGDCKTHDAGKAWAYYSSASDDEITNRENHAAFHPSVSSCILG